MMLWLAILLFFCPLTKVDTAIYPSLDEWKKVRENDYMTVWTRKKEKSEFKDIRIDARIPCELDDLVDALIDVESHTLWVFKASRSTVLQPFKDGELIYHIEIDMPFPVVDRDAVLSLKKTGQPETGRVTIVTKGVNDHLPHKEKFVRITDYLSRYELIESEEGIVDLHYTLSLDPAGKLPNWVINLAAVKGPVKTMESLYQLMTNKR